MTISKDLFLAILSMDAYNRNYGAGITLTGSSVGTATIITDSEKEFADPNAPEGMPTAAQAAGFYAVAYTMGSGSDVPPELQGKTIISYRGTDNYGAQPNTADVWNGYGIALGSPLGEQARLAAGVPIFTALSPDWGVAA